MIQISLFQKVKWSINATETQRTYIYKTSKGHCSLLFLEMKIYIVDFNLGYHCQDLNIEKRCKMYNAQEQGTKGSSL